MDTTLPESLAGVGLTAIGVALIRARETARADALFTDPYAHLFADVAHSAFLDPAAPDGASATWERMEALVDSFYDIRVLATRFFDDYLVDACANGCDQVVIVGAGLDTRAYRLPLPENTAVFEIDLPEIFEFKEGVLREQPTPRRGPRHVVDADLRGDWARELVGRGFDPSVRTAWLEEGVLPYLSAKAAEQVLKVLTGLSASGSRIAKIATLAQPSSTEVNARYQRLKELVGPTTQSSVGTQSVGDRDDSRWIDGGGWHATYYTHEGLQTRYGRSSSEPDNTRYVVSIRD